MDAELIAIAGLTVVAVGLCAVIVLVAWRWPRRNVQETIDLAWLAAQTYEKGFYVGRGGPMHNMEQPINVTRPPAESAEPDAVYPDDVIPDEETLTDVQM